MRIAFISDIHEDKVRLDEAFAILASANIDKIICLGDMVGYSVPFYGHLKTRDANSVVTAIWEKCDACVVGNHDLFAARKIPEHRTFFNYSNCWYKLEFSARQAAGGDEIYLYEDHELPSLLSDTNVRYVHALPEYLVVDCGPRRALISHYAFPDPTGSSKTEITASAQLAVHFDFMAGLNCRLSFSGNDHCEGAMIFARGASYQVGFEAVRVPDEPVWIHGPAVVKGTRRNGLMIYDSANHMLTVIPLRSALYRVPDDH